MIFLMVIQILFAGFITEALTELVVKSEIFKPLRSLLGKVPFLGKLASCGYCFSFWAALFPVLLGIGAMGFTNILWANIALSVLLVQRTANVMHNCIDKFTDKYYSQLHTNSTGEND